MPLSANWGSSPLTRGKLPDRDAPICQLGLIPAHAGKTIPLVCPDQAVWAHPRSRGENGEKTGVHDYWSGSSPLTRGKHPGLRTGSGSRGLIPAHAGKTEGRGNENVPLGAHPRSRGENGGDRGARDRAAGSSPLTRGKPDSTHDARNRGRLIPAHAGKTRKVCPGTSGTRAHPRSRGENRRSKSTGSPLTGSSPLTRGKRPREGGHERAARLIPAHAGKTLPDLRFYCADRSDLGKP